MTGISTASTVCGFSGFDGVLHFAGHDDDDHAALVHLGDELAGHGKAGHEDLDPFLEDHLHLRADHVGNRRQQIHSKRLVGQLTGFADLAPQTLRIQRRCPDHAEPTGVRHRRHQSMHGYSAHAGQQNGMFDTKLIADGGTQHRRMPPSETCVYPGGASQGR